ncbi:hypothetical protein [Dapis sp. BLCC M229]|uniref:hypothetical protein n=1 Tax=Dapis sp. BLCC M229 TaxID=3400188 RepID=UPI003CEB5963
MARNSKRLDKSKNYKNINNNNHNQLLELDLDELEYIVGGAPRDDKNRRVPPPPPSLEEPDS